MKNFIEKYLKYVIFFVVLFIPFIYSFFYLKSYWDPYGNLEDLKVAIVNLDKDNEKTYSKDFIDSLKNSDSCKFIELDSNKAADGLASGKYYAVLTIPEDFSYNFENIDKKNRSTTTLTYSPNQKSNFLASQIINSIVNSAEKNLDNEIDSKIVGNLENSLLEVPSNVDEIVKNTDEIKKGTDNLSKGIKSTKDGSNELTSGSIKLNQGINTVKNGQKGLTDGAKDLTDGADKLLNGSKSLKSGTASLNDGIKSLSDGLGKLDKSYPEFDAGIISSSDGSENLLKGMEDLNSGSGNLKDGINSYTSNTKNLVTLLSYCQIDRNESGEMILNSEYNLGLKQKYGIDCESIKPLMDGLGNEATINGLNSGASSLNEGIQKEKAGLEELTNGLNKLKESSSQIKSSINTLSSGTKKLEDGSLSLLNGVNSLNTGLTNLKGGSNSLLAGSLKLSSGLNDLSGGSASLISGSARLTNGLNTLDNGSNTLTDGVQRFRNTIAKNNDETKKKLDELIGIDLYAKSPITVNKKPYAKVDTYGKSFIPLFLSIGLWVGALVSYLVFYYDQEKKFGKLNSDKAGLKQDLIYIGISAIYGLITAFLLKNLLHFDVTSVKLYYLSSILIAVTFMSIIQCLIRVFGDLGKFIVLVILILQLTSSGGTFPVETISKEFRLFTNFLPMTYSIRLIKEGVMKYEYSKVIDNILMLILFILVSFIITRIVDFLKKKNEEKKGLVYNSKNKNLSKRKSYS